MNNGAGGLASGFPGAGGSLGVGGGTGLASQSAVMSFYGNPQATRDVMRRSSGIGKGQNKGRIREVWASNLAQEMQNLRELVEKYPYISMVRTSLFTVRKLVI